MEQGVQHYAVDMFGVRARIHLSLRCESARIGGDALVLEGPGCHPRSRVRHA